MLFEMKKLPREFKKAYLEWLADVFCDIWNRVAPHIYKSGKNVILRLISKNWHI